MKGLFCWAQINRKGTKMEPKKKLSVGGVTMELIAARGYSRNKSLFAGVNYKTGGVIFFPFFWFAFWCFEKVFKVKRLLTKIEKDMGKENVVKRANISERI